MIYKICQNLPKYLQVLSQSAFIKLKTNQLYRFELGTKSAFIVPHNLMQMKKATGRVLFSFYFGFKRTALASLI